MSHLMNFLLIIVIQLFYLNDIDGSVIDKFRIQEIPSNLTSPLEANSTKRHGKTLFPFFAGFSNLLNAANVMMLETDPSASAKSSPIVLPMVQYHPSLHDPAFPLNLAVSTYLLNQTIQPISKLLQEVKLSINNRDENNTRKPHNHDKSDNESSHKKEEKEDEDEEEEEDYLRVRLLKSKKNSNNFDDSLLLKNFIRASVVEELNKSQIRQSNSTSTLNNDNDDDEITTKAPPPPTTTTLAPLPSSSTTTTTATPTSTQFSGYYGGNAQNTSNVSLTGSYGAPPQFPNNNNNYPSYPSYPPYNQVYYGPPSGPPPVYAAAEQFRPDVYEPYEPQTATLFDPSTFAGVIDQWPAYYARGRKLSPSAAPSSKILRQK